MATCTVCWCLGFVVVVVVVVVCVYMCVGGWMGVNVWEWMCGGWGCSEDDFAVPHMNRFCLETL